MPARCRTRSSFSLGFSHGSPPPGRVAPRGGPAAGGEDADQAGTAGRQGDQTGFDADDEHRRAVRVARQQLPQHQAPGQCRAEQRAEKADDAALEQEDAPHLRLRRAHGAQDADFLAALDDRNDQHAGDAEGDREAR